jgi:hypothetical protein
MAVDSTQNYGKRLIPQVLDALARAEPDRIIYSLASFADQTAQFQTVTAAAFVKAVDKTAWFLHDRLKEHREESGKKIVPIGYIGPRKHFSKHEEGVVIDLKHR